MTHDEDLLEQLFWEFDEQRKRSGDERMAFKGKMRFYAKRIAGTERQACTELAERAAAESGMTYKKCQEERDFGSALVAAGAMEQAKRLALAICASS